MFFLKIWKSQFTSFKEKSSLAKIYLATCEVNSKMILLCACFFLSSFAHSSWCALCQWLLNKSLLAVAYPLIPGGEMKGQNNGLLTPESQCDGGSAILEPDISSWEKVHFQKKAKSLGTNQVCKK